MTEETLSQDQSREHHEVDGHATGLLALDVQQDYRDQLEQRHKLGASSSIPLGIAGLLGGAMFPMLDVVRVAGGVPAWMFWTAVSTAVYWFARAVFQLVRASTGLEYSVMPTANEKLEYLGVLKEHYKDYAGAEQLAASAFSDWLFREFAEAATYNWYSNRDKSERLFRARGALVACGIFTALAYIPHIVVGERVAGPTEVSIVSVVSTANQRGSQDDPDRSSSSASTPTSRPSSEAAERGRDTTSATEDGVNREF